MRFSSSHFRAAALAAFALAVCLQPALAQSDVRRETVAITYPLDEGVTVKFRGTTRLPRLKGEAKVRRSGRRNTRVEMEIENLPRAYEVGGVYTTYVLWAISPEGRADNLGEIKRGGSQIFNTSKVDVTTPLETFALVVTAEPHYLVRSPSRMVVLENLPPRDPDALVTSTTVRYMGNTSDYFRDPNIPDLADREFLRTPITLLGARQAVNLARYAGAERDAASELAEARAQLEDAENAWRLKMSEAEVDVKARAAAPAGPAAPPPPPTPPSARRRLRRHRPASRFKTCAKHSAASSRRARWPRTTPSAPSSSSATCAPRTRA